MLSVIPGRLFAASLLLVFASCDIDVSGPPTLTAPKIDAVRQVDDPYASCPFVEHPEVLMALTCSTYHPGSTVTGGCGSGVCFEMSFGGELRMVAADEHGVFPGTWFAWHEGVIGQPSGLIPCIVTTNGKKTRLEIPIPGVRCAVTLTTAEHVYVEHIASDPISGCFGWVECRQY
jgi:hypothetical protein